MVGNRGDSGYEKSFRAICICPRGDDHQKTLLLRKCVLLEGRDKRAFPGLTNDTGGQDHEDRWGEESRLVRHWC